MKDTVAILITTFLRDDLLKKTVQSILDNWQDNYVIIIADQNPSDDKFYYYQGLRNLEYCKLPFDCGLSYARNFLVDKTYVMGIKYCLIMPDSIQFTKEYDFQTIIDFMEEDPRRGIVGFDMKDRICWEGDLDLNTHSFIIDIPRREIKDYKDINFQRVDVIRNFFLAKTECLIHNKWDNELKLAEHEDFFWRFKNNAKSFVKEFGADIYQPYQVFYTNYIQANYVDIKGVEYWKYRQRAYNVFRTKLKKKYKISSWFKCTPEFIRKYEKWKEKNNENRNSKK